MLSFGDGLVKEAQYRNGGSVHCGQTFFGLGAETGLKYIGLVCISHEVPVASCKRSDRNLVRNAD
jgi:hypothetical protein